MKALVSVLTCCMAFAASAQTSPIAPIPKTLLNGSGIKACELTCSCAAVPGQVNRCSMYWTFKPKNNGTIVREVNQDPGACAAAVEANISWLAKHYGRTPEISLPTEAMASRLAQLEVPQAQPLPYSRKLDSLSAVVVDDPLDRQIALQTSRAQALTEDARSFEVVGDLVDRWQMAGRAAKRLVERVEAAEKSLSLATPWPRLREFAPHAWSLAICKSRKPADVAALAARIATRGDIAWTFAFADDWAQVQAPFDSMGETPAPMSFDMIAAPFFSEATEVAHGREDKSLATLLEIRAFRSAAHGVGGRIDTHVLDLDTKVGQRRSEILVSFVAEMSGIERVRSLARAEHAAVENLKQEVVSAVKERAKLQGAIEKVRADIVAQTASLNGATSRRDQRRQFRASAQKEVDAVRSVVEEEIAKLEAIRLNCGGQTYETCTDVAAKKDFDRRRYEANQRVGSARAKLANVQAALVKVNEALLADESAIFDLRSRIGEKNVEHNSLRGALEAQDKALVHLRATLQVRDAQVAALAELVSKLDEAVEEMTKVRPAA